MLQLNIYTEKSKRSILKAINMTEECRYKYLEPQVLMAGIVNEGRDMLSYVMQFLHVDRIAFCKRINEAILEINGISDEAPVYLHDGADADAYRDRARAGAGACRGQGV